uniref:Uncharacterized protein n=1 Tax=Cannabis sativa TaxID=3483 RepID=A0A803P9B2_CANSA
MVNTRRTPVAPFASSGLLQDPMTAYLGVHVPPTTGISMNIADVVNLALLAGTTNLATTACQMDKTIPMDLNNRAMSPREDPSLVPSTK